MTKRINFGKLRDVLDVPDLIGLQLDSYFNFLQRDVPPAERKNQGLQEVFNEIFPIESFDKQMSLEFVSYEIGNSTDRRAMSSIASRTAKSMMLRCMSISC